MHATTILYMTGQKPIQYSSNEHNRAILETSKFDVLLSWNMIKRRGAYQF